MTMIRHIAAASAVAVIAGLGAPGVAQAMPAGALAAQPPAASEADPAVTPVYHWQRRCWPVYRWVWTYYGWRYRYVGTRCAPPRYRPYYY